MRELLPYNDTGFGLGESLAAVPAETDRGQRLPSVLPAQWWFDNKRVQMRHDGLSVPILTGRWVRLEPLAPEHREPLRAAADDDRIWQHTLVLARGPEFDTWFDDAFAQRDAGRQFPFAVRQLAGNRLVGSTSYLDITPRHRRIEIGSTWYNPEAWGTRVNPECKLLLLEHAFEVLRVNRVALVTDLLNERSQRAIAKLGAVREGVLRAHMVSQGGRIRDSVIYGITTAEWPRVRARLLARIEHKSPC